MSFPPPWILSWILVAAMVVVLKSLDLGLARRRVSCFGTGRLLAYWFLWPGLAASRFFARDELRDDESIAWPGPLLLLLGLPALLALLSPTLQSRPLLLAAVGLALLAGAIFFGAVPLIVLAFRRQGINAVPAMHSPFLARTLSELWGGRWNAWTARLASELLALPLTRRLGIAPGLLLTFLLSGLAHELVITVPAGGGWGGPTAYFFVQGTGLLLQRCRFGRRWLAGEPGRLFAIAVVVLPLPWLIPVAYLEECILPLLGFLGLHG
ncbi:MAG: MBOAT family protein [Acidobacteriota bacterium]